MTRRLRIGVLFGGRSGEHAVSLMSAESIMGALNHKKYKVVPIGITTEGQWLVGEHALALLRGDEGVEYDNKPVPCALLADPTTGRLVQLDANGGAGEPLPDIDVFFPVLHGTFGEDGSVQGLFELASVPYVGSGVAASAVGMDKVLMKSVFAAAGLPQLKYAVVQRHELQVDPEAVLDRIADEIGFPAFVKPSNLGSSVGISKVHDRVSLKEGLLEAARYDRKLLVEEAAIDCSEIEVSVLGNEDPMASVPGEIVPSNEFYDYRAKYIDNRSELHIPARIDDRTTVQVMRHAVEAFKAIDGAGLARVDFFVHRENGSIYINEINTMPGFTRISMYPKLWDESGLPFEQLVDRLIELALERYHENAQSQRIYDVIDDGNDD